MNSPGSDRTRRRKTLIRPVALFIGLVALCLNTTSAKPETNSLPVVPLPVKSRFTDAKPFRIGPSTMIVSDAQSNESAARTVEAIRRVTDMTLKTDSASRAKGNMALRINTKLFSELPDWQRAEG